MRSARHGARWRLVIPILAVALPLACMTWRAPRTAPQDLLARRPGTAMRVTTAEGQRFELKQAAIVNDSLVDLAGPDPRLRTGIPLDRVAKVEVRTVDAVTTTGLVVGIGATIALVAAANSSGGSWNLGGSGADGFQLGSCPMVYSWDGREWRLDSGTFSGAIAPPLTRTDVDNLEYARPDRGVLRLRIATEQGETDHVDRLVVLAVAHNPAVTVAPDPAGRIHTLGQLASPLSATDDRGRDARAALAARDGWHWESALSGRDPANLADIRDGLVLTFSRPADARSANLVLDATNSPWAAHLRREFLEAHGTATNAWYDSLAADPDRARAAFGLIDGEALLSVAVWTTRGWRPQTHVLEAGPEVVKRHVVPLALGDIPGGPLRVRLESAPAFWLVDFAAIDYAAPSSITVDTLRVQRATDQNGRDVTARLQAADGAHLTLDQGEYADLEIPTAPPAAGHTVSYLVATTGWYRVHTRTTGEPQAALLAALGRTPYSVSRLATARLAAVLGER
ncbi:MAG: hypothetical protein OER21_00395 [Gemmatimonadota bacterium]|nr:hypothetical protein [Gemmatimonadota bacterium]